MFATAVDDPDLDGAAVDALVRRRPDAAGLSALDRAIAVRDLLAASRSQVQAVTREDGAVLDISTGEDLQRDEASTAEVSTVLGALGDGATHLATDLDALTPDDWGRHGVLGGQSATLFELVRETVASAVQHLRATDQTLRDLRGRG